MAVVSSSMAGAQLGATISKTRAYATSRLGWALNEDKLSVAGRVDGAVSDRLVHVEVAIADLQVEAALGVGANPGLVVNRCTLTAEVRQRHEVAVLALLAFRKARNVHCILPT